VASAEGIRIADALHQVVLGIDGVDVVVNCHVPFDSDVSRFPVVNAVLC
jgi:hypothetical protein